MRKFYIYQVINLLTITLESQSVEVGNMGLFDNNLSEEKMIENEALRELESYRHNDFLKFRQIIPLYGITNMGKAEKNFFKEILDDLKRAVKEEGLTADEIHGRIITILTAAYGEQISQEEVDRLFEEEKMRPQIEKEMKLEEKFGVPFQNRAWFECTIEEMKYSTFSNTNTRNVDTAYVIVEGAYLDLFKESVFLKSNMGSRRLYYENIASIDYDARGRLHLSNSLIINLKSSEHVQLKYVPDEAVQYVTATYEQYLSGANNVVVQTPTESRSNVDDLMKYAELYEKGLITHEEFDLKKNELMGSSNVQPAVEGAPKFCMDCGSPLEARSNFCPNCGRKIKP